MIVTRIAARRKLLLLLAAGLPLAVLLAAVLSHPAVGRAATALVQEWKSGIDWETPAVVDPGPIGGPPSDAIVLFDGSDLSAWKGDVGKWELKEGYGIAGSRIETREPFGDCQLHLEYLAPESETKDSGQGRSNNGIMLMGRYEVQVLDSYENETYVDGQCAAVYKQHPPDVNACRPPGEWNAYDIIFHAPRFSDDGALEQPADVTVLHNGVLVQDHFVLLGDTPFTRAPAYEPHPEKLPLALGYHNDPVRFRNIWIRDLTKDEARVTPVSTSDVPEQQQDGSDSQ